MSNEYKCTNCIHCEEAYYRADKMCIPQQFCSSEPRNISSNLPCKYFEAAPKHRDRFGIYGLEIHETWNEKEGHYEEDRGFFI